MVKVITNCQNVTSNAPWVCHRHCISYCRICWLSTSFLCLCGKLFCTVTCQHKHLFFFNTNLRAIENRKWQRIRHSPLNDTTFLITVLALTAQITDIANAQTFRGLKQPYYTSSVAMYATFRGNTLKLNQMKWNNKKTAHRKQLWNN